MPSICTQSESFDSSPAVSANARVITDAVPIEVSNCFVRAFKGSENV